GRGRPVVLWRADSQKPATPAQRRLRRALEAATVLLLVAAYGVYVHRLGAERDRLERQVAVAARQAAAARGIADSNARIERALALVERRQREMEPLMLLDELTRLVPDTMWVSQLTVRGRGIEMIGYSPRVSDLITRIENHEIFYNPEFRSPITRSTAGEGERFDLAFDVWIEDPP
ncbi:PilN domain-containing protein, partial [Acidisphaera rubrifaciens]|uniref:PilN domain-containing protein n=1 Tax=Acidisphaera rubrifaciens TaxID=50715 RepID=UPI000661FBC6